MSRHVCETPRDHAIQTGYEFIWIIILFGGLFWFITSLEKKSNEEVAKDRGLCPACHQKLP